MRRVRRRRERAALRLDRAGPQGSAWIIGLIGKAFRMMRAAAGGT